MAAPETFGDLFNGNPVHFYQRLQQVALLQSLAWTPGLPTHQVQQAFGLATRPDLGMDRVARQLIQRLVAPATVQQ